MSKSWTNKIIRFDHDHQITCAAYDCDVSNYKPSRPGWVSTTLNWVSYIAQKPGSYFFDFYLRRNNPYPGTFDALNTHSAFLYYHKIKNWVLGTAGMLAFGLPYLAGSLVRLGALALNDWDMQLMTGTPVEAGKNLSVLSRNTALLPDALNGRMNMRENVQRVQELSSSFIKPLKEKNKADILCLQEVFDIKASHNLAQKLSKEYPYILHNIAPSAMTFSSGLMLASKLPIEKVRYIKFPVNLLLKRNNIVGRRFNSDAFCNKGVLIALVYHQDKPMIVVNGHCQPTTAEDQKEIEHCKQIRALQLKIITQTTFDFIAECEKNDIKPNKVIMTGDFNCTDNFGPHIQLNDRKDNAYFFEDIFPGKAIDTWMKHYDPDKKDEHDGWDINQKDTDPTKTLEGVQLDHVGVCFLKDSPLKPKNKAYFDQGYSKEQPTASSDHAGILMQFK